MSLWKKFAVAAAMVLPLALGGCMQPTTQLCPTSGQPGIGEASVAQVFNGASGAHNVCTVSGADLQQGGKYSYDGGLLIIDGNVPAEARVSVPHGKLYVSGDIGQDATVKAEVPEVHSTYTTTGLMPISTGKTVMMIPTTQTHYKFEHFKYQNDTDPAVIIEGAVEDGARVTSNHDIYVGGGSAESAEFYNSQSSHNGKTYSGGSAQGYYVAPLAASLGS